MICKVRISYSNKQRSAYRTSKITTYGGLFGQQWKTPYKVAVSFLFTHRRIWCLFEIWHTILLDINRLNIIATHANFDQLKEIFFKCDVEKAEATEPADRERILRQIEQKIPFQTMNENIKHAIVESTIIDATHAQTLVEDKKSGLRAAYYYSTCARMLQFVSKYEQALPFYERALGIYERVKGLEQLGTAISLKNLGTLLHEMGKYEDALARYQRSLAIIEKVKGPEHPFSANVLTNIGTLFQSMEKYDDAEQCLQRALTIMEKARGNEHPETASSLYLLAALLQKKGENEEARSLYGRSLFIREKCLGIEHADTCKTRAQFHALQNPQ